MKVKSTHSIAGLLNRKLEIYGVIKRILIITLMIFLSMISYAQNDISCNNNGTLSNGSDDYITFQLNPTPPSPTFVSPYTYTVTAVQGGTPITILLSDGTPATNVPYAITSPFRTTAGTAGHGNITITVTPNFGSSSPGTYTISDTGPCTPAATCVPGAKTASYKYRAPQTTTDAYNLTTHIPKFNPNSGQTLTNVSAVMTSTILNSVMLENTSVPAAGSSVTTYSVDLSSNINYNLNGSSIPLANNMGTFFDQTFDLPARIVVPAGAGWPGDGTNSTLYTMAPGSSDWLRNRAFTYLDPRLDPRWVTNVTGNATHDDDIFISLGNNKTVSNSISYSSTADLAHFTGTGNIPLTYSTLTSQSILGGGGNYDARYYTQTFFEVDITYTYNETCSALPVKIKSFSGMQSEEKVALKWQVAEEMQVSHYDIEQSLDAKTFHKLSTVTAGGKDQYTSIDNNPISGKNYYRLKSVDHDGTFAYSSIINVDFKGGYSLVIYPNPVSDILSLKGENISNISHVEIMDTNGRVVKKLNESEIKNGVSVKEFTNGTYFIRILRANGLTSTRSIAIIR